MFIAMLVVLGKPALLSASWNMSYNGGCALQTSVSMNTGIFDFALGIVREIGVL